MTPQTLWLPLTKAAKLLDTEPATLRNWVKRGEVPMGHWYYQNREDIYVSRAWVDNPGIRPVLLIRNANGLVNFHVPPGAMLPIPFGYPLYITSQHAIELLGISRKCIRRRMRQGILPASLYFAERKNYYKVRTEYACWPSMAGWMDDFIQQHVQPVRDPSPEMIQAVAASLVTPPRPGASESAHS